VILIVDDDEDTREVLVLLFEEQKRKAVAVSSIEEAAELLKAGTRPTVVLLDVRLGAGGSGWDLIETGLLGDIPVVVVSGDPRDEGRAKSLGVHYLAKPFPMDKLLAIIDRRVA
jgi:CheY-like chemotaxis protein